MSLRDYMIPIGAAATAKLGRCADTWTDSDIALLRMELPVQYHAMPCEELRRLWMNIRKAGTEGYRVNGRGPRKGSRGQHRDSPDWYKDYIATEDWRNRRWIWLNYWKTCCVCNGTEKLDVHHRIYDRLRNEDFKDCIVLCRDCHDLFHEVTQEAPLFV